MTIPVTLISGFLGAGKTTLLTRILREHHGQRLAVIVNEFGAVGVDGDLLQSAQIRSGSAEGAALVELANGCICCEIQDDLRSTLLALVDEPPASDSTTEGDPRRPRWLRMPFRSARREAAPLQRILVEASGAASPGPAVQTFLIDGVLQERVHLDGVVTLVHAAMIEGQLESTAEAGPQVAYADRIVVNHADRVGEAALDGLMARLSRWNPLAGVTRAVHADVPIDWLFDVGRSAGRAPALPENSAALPAESGQAQKTEHTAGLRSISLYHPGPVDADALVIWLEFLAKRRSHELMRAKGIVGALSSAGGQPQRRVIQGVYRWLEVTEDSAPPPEASQIVLIGRDLDAAEIRRGWEAIVRG
ncbi:MAG: GTP-binding protein [Planctomycetota bacterium]